MTNDLLTTLQRTQRRMLRMIIGTPRRTMLPYQNNHTNDTFTTSTTPPVKQETPTDNLELWSKFIKRATHIAESTMTKHRITQWTTTYFRRKWRWARRLTQLNDDRWCKLVTTWNPQICEHRPAYRKQGRPCRRWGDDIEHYFGGTTWSEFNDHHYWRLHEDIYIKTNTS